MSAGLLSTTVHSLVTDGTNLYAGTRGGSVWRRPLSEVAIQIASFEARAFESSVKLDWDVTSDEEIKGFKLYRSTDGQGVRKQLISRGLIPPETRNYIDNDVYAGKVSLYQNCPNPFNPTTTISFTLPNKAHTSLSIYNVEGKLVKTLVNDTMGEGFKEITWDGRDTHGHQVSSGVYFYRLKAGKKVLTRKMAVLK
jgi:hypothetical protein